MSEALKEALTNIGIALLSLLSAYLVYYINKLVQKIKVETAKIEDEKQRKLVEDALNRVNDLAYKTVAQIEQTTAKSLRQLVKEGKADKEQLLALGKQAVDEVYAQLSVDTKKVLTDECLDVEKYIRDCVESYVLQIKEATK
jgi:vacuolar-type H+-ATPase subunit H